MIAITDELKQLVETLSEKYGSARRSMEMKDLLDLCQQIDLLSDAMPIMHPSYWRFMSDVLLNIRTGSWTMMPPSWVKHINVSKDLVLSPTDYNKALETFRGEYYDMLRELKLPNSGKSAKKVLLHWVRNPDGVADILAVLEAIIVLNNLFT